MYQISDIFYFAIYFALLVIFYAYFNYFAKLGSKKHTVSSLILANGMTSFISLILLSLLLPQFGIILAIPAEPAAIVSLGIAVWDGITHREMNAHNVQSSEGH
jgi:hypothetical protein